MLLSQTFLMFSCMSVDQDSRTVGRALGERGRDGIGVLLLKDNTRPQRNVRVAFGNSPLGPWKDISKPFTAKLTEGPTALKIGQDWLVYYDSYGTKTYGAAMTRDFQTFTDVTDTMTFPTGLKHGTAFVATRRNLDYLLKVGNKETQ